MYIFVKFWPNYILFKKKKKKINKKLNLLFHLCVQCFICFTGCHMTPKHRCTWCLTVGKIFFSLNAAPSKYTFGDCGQKSSIFISSVHRTHFQNGSGISSYFLHKSNIHFSEEVTDKVSCLCKQRCTVEQCTTTHINISTGSLCQLGNLRCLSHQHMSNYLVLL